MGVHWSAEEIGRVFRLRAEGLPHHEISERTGVPVSTLRNWLYGRVPRRACKAPHEQVCHQCGSTGHRFLEAPPAQYSCLLAVYLGDGHLWQHRGRTYSLRVALDSAYPGIIEEVVDAIEEIRGRRPWIGRDPRKNLFRVVSYWKEWPCCFPQHGPGRKHSREIVLAKWQREIVAQEPGRFLRGLIHTDGWRGLNRVHVKGRDYAYPRYQFSNRSDDIRRLFTDVCDQLRIAWRPWTRYHVSVARKDAVALLDSFVGPKG